MKIIISISFFLFFTNFYGQFTRINQSTINSFYFVKISDEHNLALAGGIKLTKSVDSGFTWNEVLLDEFAMPFTIYTFHDAIIISPLIYCLIGKDDINGKSIVIRTEDGGNNWTNVLESSNQSFIYYNSIDFNNNGTAIITTKGGVYRSIDEGLNWSFIPLSILNNDNETDGIIHNKLTNQFLINHLSDILTSFDEGISWIEITNPINNNVESMTNQNGNILISYSDLNFKFALLDSTNTLINSKEIISGINNSTLLKKFNSLNNGTLIAHDSYNFYNIDTLNEEISIYNHNLISLPDSNSANIADIAFGNNYGLAVGSAGAISRYDLQNSVDVYLPANFEMNNVTCMGDTIFATPKYSYSDSVKWFLNGQLISTNFNLNYISPLEIGTYTLLLNVFYKGNMRSDSSSFTFYPLLPSPTYTFYIDTTPCFNTNLILSCYYNEGQTFGSYIKVFFNDSLIYGPEPSTTNDFHIITPLINSCDTLIFETYRPQMCSVFHHRDTFFIQPGEDLSDNFILLDNAEILCQGDSLEFQFTQLDSTITYQIYPSSNPNNDFIFNNSLNDTVVYNSGPIMEFGGVLVNYSHHFQIKLMNNEGCMQETFLDSVQIVSYPTAIIELFAQSYYHHDTVQLSNGLVSENRLWETSSPLLEIYNITDTIPILYGTTNGVYKIKLSNKPLPGCEDSTYQDIRIADSISPMSNTLCLEKTLEKTVKISKIKTDNEGNVYVLGVIKAELTYHTPAYSLSKYDSSGNLIWNRSALTNQMLSGDAGVVIESFDFDANGNVYCALWMQSDGYQESGVSFFPDGYNESGLYIVKLNKNTGQSIWWKDVRQYNMINNWSSTWGLFRLTDIIVSDENNRIYFSLATNKSIRMCSIDLDGNFIHSNSFITDDGSFPNSFYYDYGSGFSEHHSYFSPQLLELSTGEIVGLAYYSGAIRYNNQLVPELNNNSGQKNLLAFKYNSDNEIYDFKNIIKTNNGNWPQLSPIVFTKPIFDFDANDNIIVATSWHTKSFFILDSLIDYNNRSIVFKMDKDFNLKWITDGNVSSICDIDIAKNSGEILLSGLAKNNISFGNGSHHVMAGDYPEIYTFNNSSGEFGTYFMILDSLGNPLSGRFLKNDSLENYNLMKNVSSTITPCGDITSVIDFYVQPGENAIFSDELNSFEIDTSLNLMLKWSNSCIDTLNDCPYLTLNIDSLEICGSNDIAKIVFTDKYNVDSISYSLFVDDVFSFSNTIALPFAFFEVQFPNLINHAKVIINDPILDSVTISIADSVLPIYTFSEDTICFGEEKHIFGSPSELFFSWSTNFSGDNLILDESDYQSGQNQIFVEASNIYGCAVSDTLNFHVFPRIGPVLEHLYFLECNDTLKFDLNLSDYNQLFLRLNGNVLSNTQTEFTSTNTNIGSNYFQINLMDTNNCSLSLVTEIFNNCLTADLDQIEKKYEAFLIKPNPTNRDFILTTKESLSNVQVTILSIYGQVIKSNFYENFKAINYSEDLSSGSYYIKIETAEYTQIIRLIIY